MRDAISWHRYLCVIKPLGATSARFSTIEVNIDQQMQMVADPDVEALIRLQTISKILGVSVDQFMAGETSVGLAAADECHRLWSRLKTAKGRQKALDALRRIVDDEAA